MRWLKKKQVYGKKKITPMSSIKNCDVPVDLVPHVHLLSFQLCSLLPEINFIHDCALLWRANCVASPQHSASAAEDKQAEQRN
jgi:hypothetical protein